MHLLSTYLYSFPRGYFLNAALQKQSGENAVFIVQPDVKAHGCSPPAVLFPIWRAILSPCLLNLRQRKGWAEVICLASEVTWSLLAFLLCWSNDLHFSRSSIPEKNIRLSRLFGYLMWLQWLWKPLRKEILNLPQGIAPACKWYMWSPNQSYPDNGTSIKHWDLVLGSTCANAFSSFLHACTRSHHKHVAGILGTQFMFWLVFSLCDCWEGIGEAENTTALLWSERHDLKSNPDPQQHVPHLWPSSWPRWPSVTAQDPQGRAEPS